MLATGGRSQCRAPATLAHRIRWTRAACPAHTCLLLQRSDRWVRSPKERPASDCPTDAFALRQAAPALAPGLLAASQREESLKFELLVPIHAKEHPTACVSFNYHRDLFGQAWKIETADGPPAHTACVGFGVERITLALFKHHGFAVAQWPQKVRDVLGL